METRTFRIVPLPKSSEIKAFDVLKTKVLRKPSHFDDSDDDDDVSSLSTNSTSSIGKEKWEKSFGRHSIDTIDIRDDETSPSTVLGSYHRKDRYSIPISETEKRIAQLQSAGLSISTKNPSPRCMLEDREGPPNVASKFVFRRKSLDNKKSGALQALLAEDSRKIQQAVGPPPPPPHSRLPPLTRTKSTPSPSLTGAQKEDSLDPIIIARPSYQGMRVPRNQYPDPVSFGWAFIGSCEELQVEFFEKSLDDSGQRIVVLEFHYTTGTFQVTLNQNGEESLLAFCLGSLAPRIYRKILLDPLGCSNLNGEIS